MPLACLSLKHFETNRICLSTDAMTEALQYSGDELMAMMHADGPVVKCVIVAADGTAAEVELDMTPKKEAVKEALGGAVTFLGQWEPLGVFLLVRREDGGLPKFAGRLPKPFDAATGVFGGACLMTRTDESGTPSDFSLTEYEAFAAKAPEPWQDMDLEDDDDDGGLAAVAEGDEDDDESSDDDDDDDSDDEDDAYDSDAADDDERLAAEEDEDDGELADLLVAACLKKFAEREGREPTAAERADIEREVAEKLGAGADDEAAAGEAIIVDKVVAAFTAQNGRAPTPEEIDAILDRLRATEEGGDEGEEAAEEEEGEPDIFAQLVDLFKQQNGRDPTEEEMQQWRDTLKEAAEDMAQEPEPVDDGPAAKKAKTVEA